MPSDSRAISSKPKQDKSQRKRLPKERRAIVHSFSIAGHEGTIRAGVHENGDLGEVFIHMAKHGSFVSDLLDSVGITTSMLLQNNVALSDIAPKFIGRRSDPRGVTSNAEIPEASSVLDYVFRWLVSRFPSKETG